MTYQDFLDIEYNISKEKSYYCWAVARPFHSKEDEEKYQYYIKKAEKIQKFKKEVLTKALVNVSENYFK